MRASCACDGCQDESAISLRTWRAPLPNRFAHFRQIIVALVHTHDPAKTARAVRAIWLLTCLARYFRKTNKRYGRAIKLLAELWIGVLGIAGIGPNAVFVYTRATIACGAADSRWRPRIDAAGTKDSNPYSHRGNWGRSARRGDGKVLFAGNFGFDSRSSDGGLRNPRALRMGPEVATSGFRAGDDCDRPLGHLARDPVGDV